MNESLRRRAHAIEAWAEDRFIDPNGIVYSQLDRATGQPLTPAFFSPDDDVHPAGRDDPVGMYSYENCGMTTGAYLQALVCRYETEGDPAALVRARRCVDALRHIYDEGCQLEEGFFPKLYGGRFTKQTSTDQVLYAVLALDRYCEVADEAERRDLSRMIGRMIGFWVQRGYRYGYYHIPDMLWPLARFPSLLLLAYRHTGEEQFRSEYERLLAEGVNRYPGESRLRRKRSGESPPSEFEKKQKAWVLGSVADAATMDIMELDYLLRWDPNNTWAPTWRQSLLEMWREGELAVAPDGRLYAQCLVDMETGQSRPLPLGTQGAGSCAHRSYLDGAKSGWSSMIARAAVQAAPHLDDPASALATARRILEALDIPDLSYLDEPERFQPQHQFQTRFLSGDAMANWLWAYWLATRLSSAAGAQPSSIAF